MEPADIGGDVQVYRGLQHALKGTLAAIGVKLPEAVVHEDDARNTAFVKLDGKTYELPRVKIDATAPAPAPAPPETPVNQGGAGGTSPDAPRRPAPAPLVSLVTVLAVLLGTAGWQAGRGAYDSVTGAVRGHKAALDSLRLAVAQYGSDLAGLNARVVAAEKSAADNARQLETTRMVVSDHAKAFESIDDDLAGLKDANDRQVSQARDFAAQLAALEGKIPPPSPPPAPAPEPAPAPRPTGYAGPLWALLILPDPPDAALSALRADPDVRKSLAASAVSWRTYLADSADASGYAGYLKDHPAPVVLWVRDDATLAKAGKADRSSVLADLKEIRGQ